MEQSGEERKKQCRKRWKDKGRVEQKRGGRGGGRKSGWNGEGRNGRSCVGRNGGKKVEWSRVG